MTSRHETPGRKHLGPELPPGLINRVGGLITAHHVCDRFVLYTNMLSMKSHLFRMDQAEGRWRWVEEFDNSDDGARLLKRLLKTTNPDQPSEK